MRAISTVKHAGAGMIDRLLGIEAERDRVLASTNAPTDEGMPLGYISYVPSNYLSLLWALRGRVGRDDVLVDLGCGAGRAVFFAARLFRLREVIGVEYTPSLAEHATTTAERLTRQLRTPVRIYQADAAQWVVPDDVTIVYLFNPFMGEVFEQAMAQVIASVDRAPRRLTVIYSFPTQRDALFATGRFRLTKTRKGRRLDPEKSFTLTTEVFEVMPPLRSVVRRRSDPATTEPSTPTATADQDAVATEAVNASRPAPP